MYGSFGDAQPQGPGVEQRLSRYHTGAGRQCFAAGGFIRRRKQSFHQVRTAAVGVVFEPSGSYMYRSDSKPPPPLAAMVMRATRR
ncbi:hypothetical protein L915_05268 [Phytophthora nicotianae]|uniref:Uncharacterized protein n=3 Tax=Phytophthora nicotianae TaxID=4792 RepID=V9FJD7_PHYNI|nr:hypothetical protein F443_05411 [Phytophthora nicotianae P1569]ETK91049.1 hypothetical protein L915_05268 [Phytophthora nicotianae]ETO79953.1 hypothetical protein F444_05456 [Phytophthora nicotianae P1976]